MTIITRPILAFNLREGVPAKPHFELPLHPILLQCRMPLVNDTSISARTEALRAEIELIVLQERIYRRTNDRCLTGRDAHEKREIRLREIRAELEKLRR